MPDEPRFVARVVGPPRVPSPGGWVAPPDKLPGWNWIPESGATDRHDRMPAWARVWMWFPVVDRWAHAHYWHHGGYDVDPAPGHVVGPDGWSDPPPARLRPRRGLRSSWGWDVVSNPVGNWLGFCLPGAVLGSLVARGLQRPLWLGGLAGAGAVVLGVTAVLLVDHWRHRNHLVTMGFNRMSEATAARLAERARAEGIEAGVERSPIDWRVAVPARHVDRVQELADELGITGLGSGT